MEVDLLGRDAVHAALGLGEPPERRERPLARPWREGGDPIRRRMVGRPAPRLAGRGRGATRGPRRARRAGAQLDVELEPVDPDDEEAKLDYVQFGAGVEQRAEKHVAGHAADAVHVGDAAHPAPAAVRAIRAAIVPAPKPSSIPTTASPAAHELNIDSRGVTPPNAVP